MTKNIFITGASRGIGYHTAILFAKNGYDIGFTYLKDDKKADELFEIIKALGVNIYKYKVDVKDYESMKNALDDFVKNNKKIDNLICNAGISTYGTINEISVDDIKNTIDTNIYGVINTCKIVSDYMISEKRGSIVNISSIWGITGSSCESIYSASKGAIISFSKALAKELGPSNIRVNVVAPGVVMTDMMSDFTQDDINVLKDMSALGKISYPQDIAKSILFLCSDDAISYTGQVLSPNCGILI